MSKPISSSALAILLQLVITVRADAAPWTSSELGRMTLINTYALGPFQESKCPDGKYVVGLEIRSGTLVDYMSAECASLGPNGEHQGLTQTTFLGNSSGGTVRYSRCPAGQVVTAVSARAGEFIDQVSFACRSWNATQGLHGSLRWLPKHGGSGGEPVGPIECPSGKAMTALHGRKAGSYIPYFSVTCNDQPTTQPAGTMSAQSTLNPQGRPASSSPTSRPASVPRGIKPATALPLPAAPILKTLSSKPVAGGGAEISIDGEHFVSTQGGRTINQVTRVEIAGASVPYRVVSSTRITATVPKHIVTKLNKRAVPVIVTSGGRRISAQLPLR